MYICGSTQRVKTLHIQRNLCVLKRLARNSLALPMAVVVLIGCAAMAVGQTEGYRTTAPINVAVTPTVQGLVVTWDWHDQTGGRCPLTSDNPVSEFGAAGYQVNYRQQDAEWVTAGFLVQNAVENGAFEFIRESGSSETGLSFTIDESAQGYRPEQSGVALPPELYEVRVSAYSPQCGIFPDEANSEFSEVANGSPLGPPSLVLSPTGVSVVEGETASFSVALSNEPSGDVTVTSAGAGDVSVTGGSSLTFSAANYAEPQTVTIFAAIDDDLVDDIANVSLSASGGGYDSVTGDVAVTVIDLPTVAISGVPATTNASSFIATFTFSEAVTGFDIGDITVDGGLASEFAEVVPGTTWTARIMLSGPGPLTYKVSVAANVATDAAGNGNTAAEASGVYDTQQPDVTITGVPSATNASTFMATFAFAEFVSGFEAGDIMVDGGSAAEFTEVVPGRTWTAKITLTGSAPLTYKVSVAANAATDAAGNGNTAAEASGVYDTQQPDVTITGVPSATNASSFTATFTFSEVVNGFEAVDITVDGGLASEFAEVVPGRTWTAKISLTGAAPLNYRVAVAANAATDAAGNGNTAAEARGVYDTQQPGVTIMGVPSATNAASFTATFAFTEVMSGFEAVDIMVDGGSAAEFTEVVPGRTWTAKITLTGAAPLTYKVSVAANAATDAAGNGNTAAEASGVYDTQQPDVTITGVPSATNASSFTATFTFSEMVNGFETVDITVDGGSVDEFTQTMPGTTWTAKISLTGAAPLNYRVSVAAGAATDAAGNGNTAAEARGVYDTQQPGVTIMGVPSATNAASFTATFAFTEVMSGFDVGDIMVDGGSADEFTEAVPGRTWTAKITLTGAAPLNYSVSVAANAATDAAGNGNKAAEARGVYETLEPDVTITGVPSATNASSFTATFTFSEVVNGFEAVDITVDGGLVSEFTQTTPGMTWTAKIMLTGAAPLNYRVSVAAGAATDAAGNGNTAAEARGVYDTQQPGVTIMGVPSATNTRSFTATFAFTEVVSGFEVGDITVDGGSANEFTQTTPGTTWTAKISLTGAAPLNYTVSVAANAVTDAAGNGNTAAEVRGVYDTEQPSLTITGVPSATNASSFTATFAFSEVVNGFEAVDITVDGGSASDLAQTTPGMTWTAKISLTDAAPLNYKVAVAANAVTDAAGNGNTAAEASGVYDTQQPSVTITGVPVLTNGAFTATFSFSESVEGFDVGGIRLSGATASEFTETRTGTTWTALITPTANYRVSVAENAARDAAGNGNTATEEISGTYDATRPGVTIAGVPVATNGAFTVTITFSETVNGFVDRDITVSGGSVDEFTETTAGRVWTATINPTGNFSVSVAENVATDDAGNGNTAADAVSGIYDITPPTVVISGVPEAASEAFTATFTFSKVVSGFEIGDITLTGATATDFAEITTDTVWSATITPTADYSVSVAADVVTDAGGNGNLASETISGRLDLLPSFAGVSVEDKTYTVNTEITAETLPEATGGDGPLTYSLAPVLSAGLAFDAGTRLLSGTPTAAQSATTYTYSATDADGDTVSLTFAITVKAESLEAERQAARLVLSEIARATLAGATDIIDERLRSALDTNSLTLGGHQIGGTASLSNLPFERNPGDWWSGERGSDDYYHPIDDADMLEGSAFSVSLNGEETGDSNKGWTVWGWGDYRSFKGRTGIASWDGSLKSTWLGLDAWTSEHALAGVALSRNLGEVEFQTEGGESRLETSLTAAWPYMQVELPENSGTVRAVLGLGSGRAINLSADDVVSDAGLTMEAASVGARLDLARQGQFSFSIPVEAGIVRLKTDGLDTSVIGNLEATTWRALGGIEATHAGMALSDSGWVFVPRGSLTLRQDGGDGVTGTGVEVGGGIGLRAPHSRLSMDASGHWLATHTDDNQREWGARIGVQLAPDARGRGLSLSLRQEWGEQQEDALSDGTIFQHNTDGSQSAPGTLAAQAGYGFGMMSGLLVLSADAKLAGRDEEVPHYGAGVELRLPEGLSATLRGVHVDAVDPDTRIGADVRLSF